MGNNTKNTTTSTLPTMGEDVTGTRFSAEGEALSRQEKQAQYDSFFIGNDELLPIEEGESDDYLDVLADLGTSIGQLSDDVLDELTEGMDRQEFDDYMKDLSVTDEDLEFAEGNEGWYDQPYYQEMPSGDFWTVRNDAQNEFFRALDKKLHPFG